ncbi:Uncharacterised protein [Bordetella pertussis]|nr:Uncharacterised protein [Bordetella pertussis]
MPPYCSPSLWSSKLSLNAYDRIMSKPASLSLR